MSPYDRHGLSFSEAFCRHRGNLADKWEGYLVVYDEVLQRKRAKCAHFLEIGINNGGSLEVFAEYFHHAATITGVDINPLCEFIPFEDSRINVIIGSSNDENTKQLLSERAESYDLILDDGSHQSSDIINTFINLVGLVSPGGTYIIEDLCCSYWHEFGGGVKSQTSAVGFLKRLVDIVNFEHWNSGYSLVDYLSDSGISHICSDSLLRLSTIRSVSFYNSICVVDFSSISSEGAIGKRICRGRQALAGYIPVNGQGIKEIGPDQSNNPFNVK